MLFFTKKNFFQKASNPMIFKKILFFIFLFFISYNHCLFYDDDNFENINKQSILILKLPRSGSSWFTSLLNQQKLTWIIPQLIRPKKLNISKFVLFFVCLFLIVLFFF